MIYIVHGDNDSASRNTISNLQKKHASENRLEITITDTTPDQLFMAANSFDFFGNAPFVVFDISKYGHMKLDPYYEALKKISEKSVVVIYSSKALTTTNFLLKEAKNIQATILFSQNIPTANAFKFTDYILTGQTQRAYKELKNLNVANDDDPFQIMGAILFSLRAAAYIKFNSPSAKSIAPFVRGKAEALANKMTKDQLVAIYEVIYNSDRDLKTSSINSEIILPVLIEKISGVLNGNSLA